MLSDDRKAGDIGGTVADVDHVFEGDGAKGSGDVVIDVLGEVEEAFIDAEKELGFLGVGDDAFGESDSAFGVFGEFATEDGADMGSDRRAFDERFEA